MLFRNLGGFSNALTTLGASLLWYNANSMGWKPVIDFYKNEAFSSFRKTLDAEMKWLQSQGIVSVEKHAEIITPEEEDLLWKKNLLGDHSPKSLLDTMIFYNGLFFALHSGNEHTTKTASLPNSSDGATI